ncbi:hypothetical protein T12_16969 [Trichinella patagoniensis]|uniref:Uncharacterized protein n=1 Tax=Trichinella patagoniensis TaxID=990121 RepID=A0A0V0ZWX7_9BILA|nr:hypothetical protein T12_16969 [Trichinella patagoniensis]
MNSIYTTIRAAASLLALLILAFLIVKQALSSASERNFFIPSVHEGSALKIHEALQLFKINTCAFYSSIFPVRLQVNASRLYPSAYLVSFSTIFTYESILY